MPISPEGFGDPMREKDLTSACASDPDMFFTLDDHSDIGDEDFVYVTIKLMSLTTSDEEEWAVPAQVYKAADGHLFAKFCEGEIWAIYTRPDEVRLTPELTIRARAQWSREYYGLTIPLDKAYDNLEMMMTRCHVRTLATNTAYRKSMTGKSDSSDRKNFLFSVLRKMLHLTPSEWQKSRPKDPETITDHDKAFFKTYFDQATEEATFDSSKIGKPRTNMKYVTLMMDLAASKHGPDPPKLDDEDSDDNESGIGGQDTKLIKAFQTAITKALKPMTEMLGKQQQEIAHLKGAIDILSARLALQPQHSAASPLTVHPVLPKSKGHRMMMPKDGHCTFCCMQVLGDKSEDVDCAIRVSQDRALMARSTVLFFAQQLEKDNPVDFKSFFPDDADCKAYHTRIWTDQTNTENWGGDAEVNMFLRKYPDLEIRLLKVGKKGKVESVIKCHAPDSTPTKFGFMVMLTHGHYDIGYVTMGPDGVSRLLVDSTEVDGAQNDIITHLEQPRPVDGEIPSKGLSYDEFVQQIAQSKKGEVDGDTDYITVARRDKKVRQQQKKQKDQEEREKKGKEVGQAKAAAKNTAQQASTAPQPQAQQQHSIPPSQTVPPQQAGLPAQAGTQQQTTQSVLSIGRGRGRGRTRQHQPQQPVLLQTQPQQQPSQPQQWYQPQPPLPQQQPSQPQQWYQPQPPLSQQPQPPLQSQVLPTQSRPHVPVPFGQPSQPQQWYQPQFQLPQQLQPQPQPQVLPSQRSHRQGNSPTTGTRPPGEYDIFLSGTPVVPFAVIFTGESVDRTTCMVTALAPTLAHLVSTVHQRGTGTASRCELHCKQTDLAQAVSIIQALKDKGVKGVAPYQPRTQPGPSDLSTTAGRGLEACILQTGVCRNFHYGLPCPHNPCKFKCYADAVPWPQHPNRPP